MEGTGLLGVNDMPLVQVGVVSELVPEERTGAVDLLASNNSNLLAGKDLLGDDGGQSTEQVALAVNDNRLGREGRHLAPTSRVESEFEIVPRLMRIGCIETDVVDP
jgi:hypothetical protein